MSVLADRQKNFGKTEKRDGRLSINMYLSNKTSRPYYIAYVDDKARFVYGVNGALEDGRATQIGPATFIYIGKFILKNDEYAILKPDNY